MPIELCVVGSSTGSVLIDACSPEKPIIEAGTIARNRPVAASFRRMLRAST
jgi:hypothetical protein